jgi:alanyl-tRNA synthetase
VRQAGSYVGPDKLRFDFSHGQGLSADELRDVEDQMNTWILENRPVRAITTTLDEARGLGAMALFGEKYGEIVRMVEVGDGEFSRELCGGTHVRSTAEIGLARILSETSSAANVRRIEALTGPAAVALVREHDRELESIAALLKTRPDQSLAVLRAREEQRRELERAARKGANDGAVDADALAAGATLIAGVPVVSAQIDVHDPKLMVDIADRVKGQLAGDGVVVLAAASAERANIVVAVAPSIVARGVRAGEIVKSAGALIGGGGGGRDTLAQAGGGEVAKVPEALSAATAAIGAALGA